MNNPNNLPPWFDIRIDMTTDFSQDALQSISHNGIAYFFTDCNAEASRSISMYHDAHKMSSTVLFSSALNLLVLTSGTDAIFRSPKKSRRMHDKAHGHTEAECRSIMPEVSLSWCVQLVQEQHGLSLCGDEELYGLLGCSCEL